MCCPSRVCLLPHKASGGGTFFLSPAQVGAQPSQQSQSPEPMDAAASVLWYLHFGGEAEGCWWWLSLARWWWWWVPGHLQTHEEPCEAAHTAHTGLSTATQGHIHQHSSHQNSQGHPAPHPAPRTDPQCRRCSDAATAPARFCPPTSQLCCRTKQGDTVGSGVELQAERASTALQGTLLLPAQAAIGAAWLHAHPAAPGCVVGTGETIKLQRAESKEKMRGSVIKEQKIADRLSERKGRWEMDTLNRVLGFLG